MKTVIIYTLAITFIGYQGLQSALAAIQSLPL